MKNTLRLSLNASQFPFLYRDALRAVVLPGLDMNVRHPTFTGTYDSYDWGAPQILYCENVMPIAKGYTSTQFANTILPSAFHDFDQAVTLRDASENQTLFVPSQGTNYLLDILTGTWASVLPFSPTNTLFTKASVQGRSFVFYEKEKLFEYDGGTNSLIDQTASIVFPAGFTLANIRGIGSASNYMLMFTDIDVLWSSPSDPLNFDRATNNGSGFQIPEDVRGRISCILPVSGGAIIYTVRNAVAITFTNNAATPFVFRGISNSGGVASYEQVAYDADEIYQYVWGSGGLQQVSLKIANSVFPEASDFLTSALYESYNYSSKLVEQTQLGSYLSVKLTYVSQRFLVISYGATANAYTYALIYDTVLQRWGKVKKDHVDAFTYPYPNILGDLTYAQLLTDYTGLGDTTYAELGVGVISISPPKKSIAFMAADGSIDVLAIDYRSRSSASVMLFGGIQHNRNRMTTLHTLEFEGLDASITGPGIYDLISLNGKDIAEVRPYTLTESSDLYRQYKGDAVAKSHQISVIGVFNLTGLLAEVAVHGRV
jgi:hypothetical protein